MWSNLYFVSELKRKSPSSQSEEKGSGESKTKKLSSEKGSHD
jgi:hypothetical protein